jgi:thiol-disulfide isomerase/thioredoxin
MTPRWLQIAYGLLVLGVLVGWGGTRLPKRLKQASLQQRQAKGPAKLNQGVPMLQLLTPAGEQVGLSSFRGKWVMINFWATWCAPCRREMPSMERLAKAMNPNKFVLLAASVDSNWRIVRNFFRNHPTLKRQALTMKVLRDKDSQNALRYGTSKFPETYLIDPQGRLRFKWVGPKEWDQPALLAKLKRMMQ